MGSYQPLPLSHRLWCALEKYVRDEMKLHAVVFYLPKHEIDSKARDVVGVLECST